MNDLAKKKLEQMLRDKLLSQVKTRIHPYGHIVVESYLGVVTDALSMRVDSQELVVSLLVASHEEDDACQ